MNNSLLVQLRVIDYHLPENYMQNPGDNVAVPGALGLGQSTAVNIYNAFFLFSFLTPLLFALISDIWLGRFKTLMIGFA